MLQYSTAEPHPGDKRICAEPTSVEQRALSRRTSSKYNFRGDGRSTCMGRLGAMREVEERPPAESLHH